jgi:hypothetical protein
MSHQFDNLIASTLPNADALATAILTLEQTRRFLHKWKPSQEEGSAEVLYQAQEILLRAFLVRADGRPAR